MRILALESSGGACSTAYWAGGDVRAHRFERLERGHAERLMPMVMAVMAEAGARFNDVDLFAATTGPGGFTGLRIGLATLRALALAAHRPMLGITSFDAIAHGTTALERAGRCLLVAIESKRADLYLQAFDADLSPRGEPWAATPQAIAARFARDKLLLAGDGGLRAYEALAAAGSDALISKAPALPDAALVARIAALRAAMASDIAPAPLYLRPPGVTLPNETLSTEIGPRAIGPNGTPNGTQVP